METDSKHEPFGTIHSPGNGASDTEVQGRADEEVDLEKYAAWYMRKLAQLEAETELVKANYQAIMDGLQSRKEGLKNFHGVRIKDRMQESALPGGKVAPIRTLYGTLSLQSYQESIAVQDEEGFETFVESNYPELTMKKVAFDKRQVMNRVNEEFKTTGEIHSWAKLNPGGTRLVVRRAKDTSQETG